MPVARSQHLDAYNGDHEAAAKALGWSASKLKHRVQLLHASEAVMAALVNEDIHVGHAELLASLPHEKQDRALPKIIADGMSVADLKGQLQGYSIPLTEAIFDRAAAGCATCPFNSSTQRQLFTNAVAEDRCTNRDCFSSHTAKAIDAKREQMREQFGTVVLLTEKVAGSHVPLVKHGPCGVGDEQFASCRGCQFRGAMIDNRLGAACGSVEQPLCFDKGCHGDKVKQYQATLEADKPAATDTAPASGTASTSAATTTSKPAAKKKAGAAKATPAAVSNAHAAVIRRAVTTEMVKNPGWVLGMALYGMAHLVAKESGESMTLVCKALGLASKPAIGQMGETRWIDQLMTLGTDETKQGIVAAASALFTVKADEDAPMNRGVLQRRNLMAKLAKRGDLPLLPHFTFDKDFLAVHTVDAIEQLLEESGFVKWLQQQDDGEKRWKAMRASKKNDFIKAVFAAGFDFSTFLPNALVKNRDGWAAT